MELKIPPPLYLLACFLLMWLLAAYAPASSWESEHLRFLGTTFMAIGVSFDVWSLVGFVKSKTTINPINPEKASQLVTDDLYRITRNPMYLGMALILVGWAIYLGGLSSFLLIPVFVYLLTKYQIIPEERILENLFGEEYLHYKSRVRRWI